ncbi:MAG: hypothetical protein LBE36_06645 [Flavobacteriaceae bacterium]|jgi:hypothetical protein|nr:hypothetical protein [Flavobacteriaceae bacterium]
MSKSSYIIEKNKEINAAVQFAINEHLFVLNSDIVLPTRSGQINDTRLFATVKARDKIYNNMISIIDNPDIDLAIRDKYQKEILSGLKKTMEELVFKIIRRPLRTQMPETDADDEYSDTEETSDDIISTISDAVKAATDLVLLIRNKIAVIEAPEEAQKAIIDNEIIPSIAERYAEN